MHKNTAATQQQIQFHRVPTTKTPTMPKQKKELDIVAFKTNAENHCRQELEARMVTLTAIGDAAELYAKVTNTRLVVNLTSSASVMGFYDVKNARLCNVIRNYDALPQSIRIFRVQNIPI